MPVRPGSTLRLPAPRIKALFDEATQRSGEQPRRRVSTILAFARNADNLGALTDAVQRIAVRHVAAQIRPERYPAVAGALLPAIKDVPGDAVDDRVLAAWGKAYPFLADVLAKREAALYAETA